MSSGVVHSEEIKGIYGETVSLGQEGSTSKNVYYGSGYNPSNPNLLIGGISQVSQDPNSNDALYRKVADNNHAIYVPTYYSGDQLADATAVNEAARSSPEYPKGASYLNGLTSPALNGMEYGTIIAYSGGTTSVVTAMANQGVKADTLILISPMRGGAGRIETGEMGWDERVDFDWDVEFEQKIQAILDAGTKVVIIQSDQDDPTVEYKKELKYLPDIKIDVDVGDLFQYKFTEEEWPKDRWPGLTIHDVNLDLSGNEAHWEIFSEYATDITNGEYMSEPTPEIPPEPESKTKTDKPSLTEVLGLGTPLLSPTSGTSGFCSAQNVPETSGVSYFDQANDVWYIDAFEWHYGDRSNYDKPAAPRRFVSGELNTFGYNWVSLPYSRTGMTYDQDYFNWCAETLAALGQSAPSAGYGLLIDDSQSGGW